MSSNNSKLTRRLSARKKSKVRSQARTKLLTRRGFVEALEDRLLLALTAPTGNMFNLDANLDTDGDSVWENTGPGTLTTRELLLDTGGGVTRATGLATATVPGISAAYDFPGSGNTNAGNTLGARLRASGSGPANNNDSFQDASGNWSDESVSIEIWFKVADLVTERPNGEVLFEDGGGTGLGFFMNDNNLELRKLPDGGLITWDVTAISGEFIQAVAVFNRGAQPGYAGAVRERGIGWYRYCWQRWRLERR